MRTRFKKLILAMMLAISLPSFAHDFEVDGVYYNILSSTDKTVEVTYKGTIDGWIVNDYAGRVTIPKTITYSYKTYSVTSIGDGAFFGCSGLTEVNYNAENCTSMGSYNYPVFNGCTNLNTVNIGSSVEIIPNYAFSDCSGLTEVTIPNSVTSIGESAFYNCSGLTEVTIGNSVTSIKGVFGGCEKITKLVIADGTETLSLGNSFTDCPFVKLYIGRDYSYNTTNSPFSNKKSLKEITIGNSITSIREKEFLNCIGLTSLTIGTGVLSIGTNAFSYYDNNNYSNLDIKKVIWLTNTPPQGYETVAGEVNYVANNRYSDLSNVTNYPYLT